MGKHAEYYWRQRSGVKVVGVLSLKSCQFGLSMKKCVDFFLVGVKSSFNVVGQERLPVCKLLLQLYPKVLFWRTLPTKECIVCRNPGNEYKQSEYKLDNIFKIKWLNLQTCIYSSCRVTY